LMAAIAWSFHNVSFVEVSMPIACAIRAARLYLPSSQKFLVAISVTMYHPLNGAAEYFNPPKSRVMFETAVRRTTANLAVRSRESWGGESGLR
jgi:hypothetical protein